MDDIERYVDDAQAASKLAYNCVMGHRKQMKYTPDKAGLDDFRDKTEAYFGFIVQANKSIEGKRLCADIEGWCGALGITRATLGHYLKTRSPEWVDYIEYIKGVIVGMKKQFMLNGRIPPIVGIFDLTNNHGYFNTNTFSKREEEKPMAIRQELTAEELFKLPDGEN